MLRCCPREQYIDRPELIRGSIWEKGKKKKLRKERPKVKTPSPLLLPLRGHLVRPAGAFLYDGMESHRRLATVLPYELRVLVSAKQSPRPNRINRHNARMYVYALCGVGRACRCSRDS